MPDHFELPLTSPVTDIVFQALDGLRDTEGLDRDEAYLLDRLKRGWTLELREPEDQGNDR